MSDVIPPVSIPPPPPVNKDDDSETSKPGTQEDSGRESPLLSRDCVYTTGGVCECHGAGAKRYWRPRGSRGRVVVGSDRKAGITTNVIWDLGVEGNYGSQDCHSLLLEGRKTRRTDGRTQFFKLLFWDNFCVFCV